MDSLKAILPDTSAGILNSFCFDFNSLMHFCIFFLATVILLILTCKNTNKRKRIIKISELYARTFTVTSSSNSKFNDYLNNCLNLITVTNSITSDYRHYGSYNIYVWVCPSILSSRCNLTLTPQAVKFLCHIYLHMYVCTHINIYLCIFI